MENLIIVGIILILVLIGARSTLKHFKHESSCCGGGSKPIQTPEKKLEKIIVQKTFIVDGMTCEHCKAWVEKSVNKLDGAACKVNLKKKEAVVSLEKEVSDEEIILAIEAAGYKVVEMR